MRKAVIALLMTSVLLAMGVLRAMDLITARDEAIREAEQRATTLALILSEYLSQTFAAADAALRQLALHSARIGGPHAPAADWLPSLASAHAGLTAVGSISVIDGKSIIRHSTLREIVGQSRESEVVFQRALLEPSDTLIVGTPFQSPVQPGTYVVPLGRRLTNANDEVVGAVVASFLPGDLRPFLRSVSVGERGALWIFHDAGLLIAREPSSAASTIGQTATDNPLFIAATESAQRGILRGAIEPGGGEQIAAFRRDAPLPVIVGVTLDRSEVLAPWRREATASTLSSLIVAAALAVTLVILFRQLDAKARTERELDQTRQREAAQLREAHDRLAATLAREQAARREAEAANALKDQFVMTVSHELRTPLTAIAGWARMLVDGWVGDEDKERALRTIERNAQAQTRLIEDLLDVGGVMTGKLRLDIRDVNVADVVHNAVEALGPAVGAKGLVLDVQVDADVGHAAADPARLQQILWNLLSNAVKFTPASGRVAISAARRDGVVEIRVSDTGQGIAPDFLPFVFERFRQGTGGTTRPSGGLGLGLAIVRSLVEMHGGDVAAHSDGEGRGAVFVVRLPARPVADAVRVTPQDAPTRVG